MSPGLAPLLMSLRTIASVSAGVNMCGQAWPMQSGQRDQRQPLALPLWGCDVEAVPLPQERIYDLLTQEPAYIL